MIYFTSNIFILYFMIIYEVDSSALKIAAVKETNAIPLVLKYLIEIGPNNTISINAIKQLIVSIFALPIKVKIPPEIITNEFTKINNDKILIMLIESVKLELIEFMMALDEK